MPTPRQQLQVPAPFQRPPLSVHPPFTSPSSLTSKSLSITDIKYTPCLAWPRCGYPTQECPLKHPQIDNSKLSTPQQQINKEPQSLIIPHDTAYASAVQYHNPVPPSAETFAPPPQPVAVRVSHPSSSNDVVSAGPMGGFGAFGGGLQGRGRRVSIAVQREFGGGALGGDGKEFVRGHGRGRVRRSVFGLGCAMGT